MNYANAYLVGKVIHWGLVALLVIGVILFLKFKAKILKKNLTDRQAEVAPEIEQPRSRSPQSKLRRTTPSLAEDTVWRADCEPTAQDIEWLNTWLH